MGRHTKRVLMERQTGGGGSRAGACRGGVCCSEAVLDVAHRTGLLLVCACPGQTSKSGETQRWKPGGSGILIGGIGGIGGFLIGAPRAIVQHHRWRRYPRAMPRAPSSSAIRHPPSSSAIRHPPSSSAIRHPPSSSVWWVGSPSARLVTSKSRCGASQGAYAEASEMSRLHVRS